MSLQPLKYDGGIFFFHRTSLVGIGICTKAQHSEVIGCSQSVFFVHFPHRTASPDTISTEWLLKCAVLVCPLSAQVSTGQRLKSLSLCLQLSHASRGPFFVTASVTGDLTLWTYAAESQSCTIVSQYVFICVLVNGQRSSYVATCTC